MQEEFRNVKQKTYSSVYFCYTTLNNIYFIYAAKHAKDQKNFEKTMEPQQKIR